MKLFDILLIAAKKADVLLGGQAVIEGVMMRFGKKYAIACRNPKGKIVFKVEKAKALSDKHKWLKTPFIRGTYSLFSSMAVGLDAISWSANASAEKKEEELTKKELVGTIIVSILFSILLFVLLPLFLTKSLSSLVGVTNPFLFNSIDGLFRVLIFVSYILIISRFDDVKRMFMYHGAEHKAVHAYEQKLEMNVKNVEKMSRFHERCGTSFIVIVLAVMIFSHTFIIFDSFWFKFLGRIFMLPIIAGISYEVLVFSSKYDNIITRTIKWLGFRFQSLTTKEPSSDMIEVSIMSLKLAVGKRSKKEDSKKVNDFRQGKKPIIKKSSSNKPKNAERQVKTSKKAKKSNYQKKKVPSKKVSKK